VIQDSDKSSAEFFIAISFLKATGYCLRNVKSEDCQRPYNAKAFDKQAPTDILFFYRTIQ